MTMTDAAAYHAVKDDPAALAALHARWDTEDDARHARLARPEALAEAAAWYAAQGIAVFPLYPHGKLPANPKAHPTDKALQKSCKRACGRDGHGFYDATTDPEHIAAWWSRWPQANIGAPTGRTFDVIDVDGPTAQVNIGPYIESIRARSIGLVSTPRPGGLHYYVPPGGRRNSASTLVTGVDTRAEGGYCILPPSVTDEHGPNRRYTWVRPLAVA